MARCSTRVGAATMDVASAFGASSLCSGWGRLPAAGTELRARRHLDTARSAPRRRLRGPALWAEPRAGRHERAALGACDSRGRSLRCAVVAIATTVVPVAVAAAMMATAHSSQQMIQKSHETLLLTASIESSWPVSEPRLKDNLRAAFERRASHIPASVLQPSSRGQWRLGQRRQQPAVSAMLGSKSDRPSRRGRAPR